jgi:protein TonB
MKYKIIITLFLINSSVIAQNMPKWEFKRVNKSVILTHYTDGKEIFTVTQIDSFVYRLSDTMFLWEPDITAQFPCGTDSLSVFIRKNLDYVEYSTIIPRVYVAFIVEKSGKIKNIGIYRGVDERYDKAAIKLVKKMPKWQPAKLEDKYVDSFNILCISFEIK